MNIKISLALIPICLASVARVSLAAPVPAPADLAGDWQLALDENFDGDALNTKLWNDQLWFPGTANQEQQRYLGRNVVVKDGKLQLIAKKETVETGWDGSSATLPKMLPYTSGIIQSRDKFESGYGVYEARIKLPKGKGLFPAFWIKTRRMEMPEPPPPPEIDIMENLGHEMNRTYHTYHYFGVDKKALHSPGNLKGEVDFSADFHTFTAAWTPTSIRWFVDGVESRKPFDQPEFIWKDKMFVVLNLAIGSGWSGLPNENTAFPQTMEVDYVRVWQPKTPLAPPAGVTPLRFNAVTAEPAPQASAPPVATGPLKMPSPILVDGKPFVPNGIYMGGDRCWGDDGYPGKVVKGGCVSNGAVPAMWDLDRIAAAGFNTVLSYSNGARGNAKDWTEHVASIKSFLDRADERKLKVIFSLKDMYRNKTGEWFLNNDNLGKTLALFKTSPTWKGEGEPAPLDVARDLVRRFKDHPALLAWNINDELSTEYVPELQAMYEMIKTEDKENPVMQLLYKLHDPGTLHDPAKYVSSTDILAADPYPVGLGRPFTLDTAGDWTRKLVAAGNGKKTVWMAAQAYARNFDPPPQMSELAPTLDEERNMSYQMLINGANGILYWSLAAIQIEPAPLYNPDGTVRRSETELATNLRGQILKNQYGETVKSVQYEPLKNADGTMKKAPNGRPVYAPNFPRRWPEMKAVAAEMNQLQAVIATGQDVDLPKVELPAKVQRRALRVGDSLYLLVVNTDHRVAATVSWPLPVGGMGRRIEESRELTAQLSVDGKELQLTVPPLGSGFVRIKGFKSMKKRPHVLLFNPDQWRGDALGHLGHPAARTPVLDQCVARDFVSFRHAFCQNPVCTPSRCSFMSGWYPHVRGHRTMHHMLRADEPMLLRTLKQNGYFVWWGGKNDVVPAENGFSEYCDVKYRPDQPTRPDLHSFDSWRGEPGSDSWYSFYGGRLDKGEDDLYLDNDWAFVLGAIEQIKAYSQGDQSQPLCLYLPLAYPHPPYAVEEPYFSSIDRAALPRRIPAPDSWSGKPSLLRGIHERQNLHTWGEERWTELRATYLGMCARVDHQFGLVLDALREAGLYDETAVFFFSDHGDFTGDYGLVEKTQNTFEDCLVGVPLLVKAPAGMELEPGVSEALVELVDVPATVLDFAGIEPDYSQFGRSLRPVLQGATEHRDAVFSEGGRLHGETHCMEAPPGAADPRDLYWPRVGLQSSEGPEHTKAAMCRTREWKYVRRLYESDELYDLRTDPGEERNVIDEPAHAAMLGGLRERLLQWYQETCDVVPHRLNNRY